jgi:hypothetical protein
VKKRRTGSVSSKKSGSALPPPAAEVENIAQMEQDYEDLMSELDGIESSPRECSHTEFFEPQVPCVFHA